MFFEGFRKDYPLMKLARLSTVQKYAAKEAEETSGEQRSLFSIPVSCRINYYFEKKENKSLHFLQ